MCIYILILVLYSIYQYPNIINMIGMDPNWGTQSWWLILNFDQQMCGPLDSKIWPIPTRLLYPIKLARKNVCSCHFITIRCPNIINLDNLSHIIYPFIYICVYIYICIYDMSVISPILPHQSYHHVLSWLNPHILNIINIPWSKFV